jgi:putative glutamine amidotransferase
MKPVILLTTGYYTSESGALQRRLYQNYPDGVENAGGLALLALVDTQENAGQAAKLADGLLLTGGVDINPARYGEPVLPRCGKSTRGATRWKQGCSRPLCAKKNRYSASAAASSLSMPRWAERFGRIFSASAASRTKALKAHAVQAAESSALEEMFGRCFSVNSLHHQAVRTLAPGLRTAAWSKEGSVCLVEAVWHETLPVFAVQWHPERMVKNAADETAGPDMAPLFSYFVRLCAAARAAK